MVWKSDGCDGDCMRGTTSAHFVPNDAKVNNEVFIKSVLEPLFEYDVPRLYPGQEKKVILHMDSAGAHVHANVVKWLCNRKINFIPKEEWFANSPDLSPMNYGMNSVFKNKCNLQKAKDKKQLVLRSNWHCEEGLERSWNSRV